MKNFIIFRSGGARRVIHPNHSRGVGIEKTPYLGLIDLFLAPPLANLGTLIANMNSKLANFIMCEK